MGGARRLGLPAAPAARRLVLALGATTVLLWLGASAILPLLPSYLRAQGASFGLVGVIMAAYYAASVLTQYPAGRLADTVGPRAVVAGGLLVFAGASAGFALARAPAAAIGFRALEGVGAGAVTVAAAAAIGTRVVPEERGGAFGLLYGSQMLALAVGPLVGSLLGAASMRLLFLGACAFALLAVVPLLAALGRVAGEEGPGEVRPPPGEVAGDLPAVVGGATGGGAGATRVEVGLPEAKAAEEVARRAGAALVGVVLAFGAAGLVTGVYESCWTLLLRLRHASSFEVGLSWTLFALPFAALSVPAGRLAQVVDRRWLTVAALFSSAAFCVLYPALHSVELLVGLGVAEAAGAVLGGPPAVLLLSEAVPAERQGAAQGVVETARTATTAVAAAASGALFAVAAPLPFDLAAGLVVGACVLIAWRWRSLPGRSLSPPSGEEQLLLATEGSAGAPESPPRGRPKGR